MMEEGKEGGTMREAEKEGGSRPSGSATFSPKDKVRIACPAPRRLIGREKARSRNTYGVPYVFDGIWPPGSL